MNNDTLRSKVACGVCNCAYNTQEACNAEALQVKTMDGKKDASTSVETCCMTFKTKA